MSRAAARGFTDRAREVFLDALSRTGNITKSAADAEVDRRTVYHHRESDPEFAAAWDDALAQATDRLELEARRRAEEGVPEPVFYQGVEVGTVRKYSDTLMIQLLKAHHPSHRETRRIQLGGDPDSPPIASTQANVSIDLEQISEDEKSMGLELVHSLLQRGAVKS